MKKTTHSDGVLYSTSQENKWDLTIRELKEIIDSLPEEQLDLGLQIGYEGVSGGVSRVAVKPGEDGYFCIIE